MSALFTVFVGFVVVAGTVALLALCMAFLSELAKQIREWQEEETEWFKGTPAAHAAAIQDQETGGNQE